MTSNLRPSRLLIVDDNEMNRDMLARRLTRKGYVIGLASSAKELLERVQRDAVDLVLLDIEMPNINGLDALKTLREQYSPAQPQHAGDGNEQRIIRRYDDVHSSARAD